MDKIFLQGLTFRGFHGVLPEERALGQPFIIDLELCGDFLEAGREDNLELAVDYSRVYLTVKQIVEENCYRLIETLAQKIAEAVLAKFTVHQVVVRVNKPHAPIAGNFSNVAVEIVRSNANETNDCLS